MMRIYRATFHPAFYAILGAIALQGPAAAYQAVHAESLSLANAQAVLRIADGFGLFALAILELLMRERRS